MKNYEKPTATLVDFSLKEPISYDISGGVGDWSKQYIEAEEQ